MPKTKVASLIGPTHVDRMFEPDVLERIKSEVTWIDCTVSDDAKLRSSTELTDAAVCLCTWGAPRFTAGILDQLPNLRLIVYAAGTIKGIVTDEVYARGITITSGAPAIATNVGDTMLGLVIAMMKNSIDIALSTREKGWRKDPAPRALAKEMIGTTVGVIGAGNVGRRLLTLLRNFDVKVLIFDPMLSAEGAAELGGQKVPLEDLMSASDVVAVTAPGIPATRHMIDAAMLKRMKDGSALVSAAAGSIIDENALVDELRTGRVRACLDCTYPEPPAPDHPLLTLPNVYLTQHTAGVTSTGYFRLGRYVAEEISRFTANREALNPIRQEQLAHLA